MKAYLYSILTFVLFLPSPAQAEPKPFAATCLGPVTSSKRAVYLHGMDPLIPSKAELANQATMEKLAGELGMRIAVLRSDVPCPKRTEVQCWGAGSFPVARVKETLARIDASLGDCFPGPKTPYGMIGFSNGGFFVSRTIQYCLRHAAWVVAIGSDGKPQPGDPADLSSCGPMTMLIGKRDRWHHGPALAHAERLKQRKGSVEWKEFDGGHEVPFAPLRDVLKKHLNIP